MPSKEGNKKKEKEELVITPAGPRLKSSVHLVKPGEAVRVSEKTNTSITDELVLTPGGFRQKSLVHHIESGNVLDGKEAMFRKLTFDGKKVAELGEVVRKRGDKPLMPLNVFLPAGIVPALGSGWITYAWWTEATSGLLSLFKTSWVVPPAPSTNHGQTIFLFNGIQNNSMIYQPVLQWGPSAAGGGPYWTVASWYADGQGGQAFHSTLVPVNPGDVLTGIMVLTGHSGALCSYNCYFQGIPNTSLPIQNIQELTWLNETLEAYNCQVCSDYPATLKTRMYNIELIVNSLHPILNWTPVNAITDCGQHCVTVSNANPGGVVDLYYRTKTKEKDKEIFKDFKDVKDFHKEFKEKEFYKEFKDIKDSKEFAKSEANDMMRKPVDFDQDWRQWIERQVVEQMQTETVETRLARIEAVVSHFIEAGLRPDLSQSSLAQEPEKLTQAMAAQKKAETKKS
jgi:hypothetical protein